MFPFGMVFQVMLLQQEQVIFRMYNDRHWLTDVVAGAGIGILSTKIAYWINPFIQKKIFNSRENNGTSIIAPFYNGKQFGVGFVKSF
jgi:hypothetical protein